MYVRPDYMKHPASGGRLARDRVMLTQSELMYGNTIYIVAVDIIYIVS